VTHEIKMKIRIIDLDPILCVLPWSMEVAMARKGNVAEMGSFLRPFCRFWGFIFTNIL
jgi:hypothetical protein